MRAAGKEVRGNHYVLIIIIIIIIMYMYIYMAPNSAPGTPTQPSSILAKQQLHNNTRDLYAPHLR